MTLASLAVTGHQRIWKEATCPVNPKGVLNKIGTVLSDASMTREVGSRPPLSSESIRDSVFDPPLTLGLPLSPTAEEESPPP